MGKIIWGFFGLIKKKQLFSKTASFCPKYCRKTIYNFVITTRIRQSKNPMIIGSLREGAGAKRLKESAYTLKSSKLHVPQGSFHHFVVRAGEA